MVAVAAAVLLGILGIGGWVGFKTLLPAPETASARPISIAQPITAPIPQTIDKNIPPPKAENPIDKAPQIEPEQTDTPVDESDDEQDAFWSDRSVEIMPGSNDEQQADETQSGVGRTIPSPQTEITPESKVDQPDKTPPPSVEKSPVDSPAKSEPVSKAPTTQPSSKTPTTQPSSKAPTTQPAPRQAQASDYPSGLTLTAVMYGKTSRRAIISGTVAYEGDVVRGTKIVKILSDSVEVEANGFRFLLGTGPKPVWLKATQVTPRQDKKPDTDSQE